MEPIKVDLFIKLISSVHLALIFVNNFPKLLILCRVKLHWIIFFRETPTSAGPNSFGKTKQGFCDAKKVFEKNLKQASLENSGDDEGKKEIVK